ncbi:MULTISPECIES: hybrid sensor histidine kinase/response regulator [unclassified Myxococcus]|uniref:ATP-binding response regulator n=1 Tax=unclassified Myxococcus TaxID=2648731 RepID=UPI001CBA8E4D|nr:MULTISPECIES: hybrid sensor histidine kinase/response regulator [unclassified Myxococcus]MBZ4395946.1 hybrid sensor histidine kinase/response regulator [Myxococcus sp. AS-1-15]MBZ4408947.1 hybrid sensor histidine kinase/response regulator [Myxococcus sp. XM-1-1-1]BDT37434.1 hybrid sensor histidine kinase/response regulator [Myxococcus sp. MH1]
MTLPPDVEEAFSCLPQALVRVGPDLCVQWCEASFARKTGLALSPGHSLLSALEQGRSLEAIELAVREGRAHTGHVITRELHQVRVQVKPGREEEVPGAWLVVEPSGVDDDGAFSLAVREIARAVGESLEVDSVCAAAVVALVRCAQVRRAEVYLCEEDGTELRRSAVSDLAGTESPEDSFDPSEDPFHQALTLRQAQLGIQRGYGDSLGSIFAAVPLCAPRRTVGLLLLYKEQGTSFSARELELWTAAANQLAVAVENARLLREAKAALQVREEFMSIASHELKTPLTPLKLGLYTMERRLTLGQPLELSTVLKSKRQVERLVGLVDDLLDASRLDAGRLALDLAPLELGQLVAEVVDHFRAAFERPFAVEVPRERVWVRGDRDRLEQVLVNLLENAHKYSPPGEPIVVRVEKLASESRIHVQDHGIGIPGADQSQVFQRFYRARNVSHRNFGGLGLGLFISHSIARLHGGALTLASAEGHGSTFTVSLPRMPAHEVKMLPRRVLLLDEDSAQEAMAERVLCAEGFEVLTARDGAEALRRATHLPVDLIVLSTSATHGQAGVFLETFATLPRARPVPILLAGDARPWWAQEETSLCTRPYVADELVARVRNVLTQERRRTATAPHVVEEVAQVGLLTRA